MVDDKPGGETVANRGAETRDERALFAALYEELRRLADRELRRHPGASVSPTTLVHEAYVNMAGREGTAFDDRGRFLGYAARAMRGLLIDFARRQRALKRGAGFEITQLDTRVGEETADGAELERLADALDELATLEPRLAEVVDLKYFCGFSFVDIARLRGTSERTVQRDWEKARLVLFRRFQPEG
ncbi:MAG TPA: ECF-type sigma factor [Steroidobacteraceae bacterium]|nr:ECF-type sigma factor [Steroidobacteraceae bacterium]